mmetsp:Transcript_116125/g.308881  ORF Transcript_116125/g.308881 Transcript_116125/m.308881 type:complete len:239 (-) Transcript_116125:768-1484(-)
MRSRYIWKTSAAKALSLSCMANLEAIRNTEASMSSALSPSLPAQKLIASRRQPTAFSGLFCCRCRAATASQVRGCTRSSSGNCVSASRARSILCCPACNCAKANNTSTSPGFSFRYACRISSHFCPFFSFSVNAIAAWTTATRGWPGKDSQRRWSSRRASSALCACNKSRHLLMAISIVCFLVSLCSKDSFEAMLMRFSESKRDFPSDRSATTLLQATASTVTSTSWDWPARCLSTRL